MFGTFPTIPMGFGGFGIDSVTNRSFCHRELTETPFSGDFTKSVSHSFLTCENRLLQNGFVDMSKIWENFASSTLLFSGLLVRWLPLNTSQILALCLNNVVKMLFLVARFGKDPRSEGKKLDTAWLLRRTPEFIVMTFWPC